MRVSGLTADSDWRFGKGRAVYLRRSEAIQQSVVTRLKSFTEDWFLDIADGLPWIELLGNKSTEKRILREMETRILGTEGVRLIERLRVTGITQRSASIELTVIDIFDERFDETITIP